ncbi:MAG TPA: LysR substrate-binding domain-containing protein [Lacunisphaera sp.]|nr:LysR substrate-binding domain-containing protein [Lacunisphaera sp.]
MELRHLRYFTAVAEELNFRRAAARLHLSTPTLSQQIKDLEDELGVQLLERDTTRVRLTVPGELFLRDAREILALAQRATTTAGEAGAGRRGTLRIGNAGPLSHGFMPACLQAFARKYPEVEVVLVEIDLNEQAAAVKAGTIEIGFTLRPKDAAGLGRHPVVDAPLRALLGTGHPLARQKVIALADLAGQRLLTIGGAKVSSHAELILRVFAGRGLKAPAPKPVNGYEAFLAMVASGQGVSLLHKTPSLGSIETLTTRPLKETGPDLRLQASAIWSAQPVAPIVANFLGVLRTIRPAV